MTTFKIVFTFDVFFSAETTCTAKWHVFYIRNGHISVSSFIYKYDQWPHDRKSRCLRGRLIELNLYLYGYGTSHCVKLWKDLIESYRHGMCFRIIHFILISSARVIFDVSSGLYFWNVNRTPTWHLSKMNLPTSDPMTVTWQEKPVSERQTT
jgi:hypothetical protein